MKTSSNKVIRAPPGFPESAAKSPFQPAGTQHGSDLAETSQPSLTQISSPDVINPIVRIKETPISNIEELSQVFHPSGTLQPTAVFPVLPSGRSLSEESFQVSGAFHPSGTLQPTATFRLPPSGISVSEESSEVSGPIQHSGALSHWGMNESRQTAHNNVLTD